VNFDMLGRGCERDRRLSDGREMAVQPGQLLEITDALWEPVAVFVVAGKRVDERPARLGPRDIRAGRD
jgi:hypothetical protein